MKTLLILSHGHPAISHGGAETAAYALHRLVKRHMKGIIRSVFVARAEPRQLGHDGRFASFRALSDEILVAPPPLDHLFQCSLEPDILAKIVDDLCRSFNPSVVHIHHFAFWGTDVIDLFKQRGVAVIFTFHEYIAICHRFGQMVKTSGRLCDVQSHSECAMCFPDISSGMFFLRYEMFVQSLKKADALFSPSEFLAARVAEWSSGQLTVEHVENPRDLESYESEGEARVSSGGPFILGYFGQLNEFKGIIILLEALKRLKRQGVDIVLRIYGANLQHQDVAFQEKVQSLIEDLGEMVEFFGAYANPRVVRLMTECDGIVVPSIWWENSPVVIQEAIQANVRIIVSNIGGMKEKVSNYERGFVFEVGSSVDLAANIVRAISDRDTSIDGNDFGVSKRNEASWKAIAGAYAKLSQVNAVSVAVG